MSDEMFNWTCACYPCCAKLLDGIDWGNMCESDMLGYDISLCCMALCMGREESVCAELLVISAEEFQRSVGNLSWVANLLWVLGGLIPKHPSGNINHKVSGSYLRIACKIPQNILYVWYVLKCFRYDSNYIGFGDSIIYHGLRPRRQSTLAKLCWGMGCFELHSAPAKCRGPFNLSRRISGLYCPHLPTIGAFWCHFFTEAQGQRFETTSGLPLIVWQQHGCKPWFIGQSALECFSYQL